MFICLMKSPGALAAATKFIIFLYRGKANMGSLNKLRVKIAVSKSVSLQKIPPCEM